MAVLRRAIWLLFILAVTAKPALSVGKVAVDPNTAGPSAAAIAPDTDTRLDQRITYEARRKTVSAILADLSKMTGVTLLAGYNNVDWQTRDRKMNVFATDTSLKSIMDSIAHVMRFKWSRKDLAGVSTYRLYMDRKTLLGIERQRLMEEERYSRLEAKQRAQLIDDFAKAAAMSDDELEKLRIDDPMLYVDSKIGWTTLMADLFSSTSEAAQAWTAGEYLQMNAADLPPPAQQAVLKTLKAMGEFQTKVIGPGNAPPKEISKVTITINKAKTIYGFRGDTYMGDMTVNWPGGRINSAFMDPDSEVAKATALDYIRILDAGPVGAQQQNAMNSGHLQAVQEQKTDFGEPLIEHPEDPALLAKVKLKIRGPRFDGLLAAVAKASGLAVVSDSFAIDYSGLGMANQETPLKDILEKISSLCRYNWEKRGSVIEFRDRDWFRRRNAQIPEAWMEPWRKELDKTETLGIDKLGQIAILDDDQLRENVFSDDVFAVSAVANVVTGFRDLLKTYACLDDQEQDEVFGDGLDLTMLSRSQWQTAARAFRSKPLFKTDSDVLLMGKAEPTGKQTKYSFTASSSTASAPIKWDFTTPLYDLARKISILPWTDAGSQAMVLFAQARKAKLSGVDAWFQLGMVLYDGKCYPEALEAFEHLASAAKSDALNRFLAFTWKGHILDLTGHREDAINAYKEALKIDIGSQSNRHDQYDIVIDRKWVEERLKTPFVRPALD